jgi:hypothetical protein
MVRPKRKKWLRNIFLIAIILLLGFSIILATQPAFVANGADFLRSIIGDKAVAQLETDLFQIQDSIQQTKYKAGLLTPSNPWQTSQSNTNKPTVPVTNEPALQRQPVGTVWQPDQLKPIGNIPGEGIWLPFINDSKGRTVAYRTFLNPDPKRPYVTIAVVALDLTNARLHYVLGINEPHEPGYPRGNGLMPENDKTTGVLLAMFNGGFRGIHGHFGAMSNGILALPARDGYGTIAIYNNGSVNIGAWGSDIQTGADMQSWRQNGPLIVLNGQINPRVYINSTQDWGYTVNGETPTWRSSVGISQDKKTLYYYSGLGMTMERLANSIIDSGATNAIQLDMNNFWVLFTAVHYEKDEMKLEPLLPNMENIDRYLQPSGRDFFYLTSIP